ncbi:hypothetical protein IQ216_11590 [Cyanobium sp. LEGE 06143]|uniref:hypothetical protein n=1 Tax=Cyanobium sp. LEGE 06143 TaxID=945727 RepID=UPI001880FA40|nr:hypothetical protein [Cyanobium sp. LEGE 06143]MBE9173689.1 hypothetical protein [Cyanobium sp. LEGE 06143]
MRFIPYRDNRGGPQGGYFANKMMGDAGLHGFPGGRPVLLASACNLMLDTIHLCQSSSVGRKLGKGMAPFRPRWTSILANHVSDHKISQGRIVMF